MLALLLPMEDARLVNVNLPPEPTGVRWVRQSVRHYDGVVTPTKDPYGRELHWLSVRPLEEVEEDTDRWAMRNGLVAMTPLRLDLTDHAALERLRAQGWPAHRRAAHGWRPGRWCSTCMVVIDPAARSG